MSSVTIAEIKQVLLDYRRIELAIGNTSAEAVCQYTRVPVGRDGRYVQLFQQIPKPETNVYDHSARSRSGTPSCISETILPLTESSSRHTCSYSFHHRRVREQVPGRTPQPLCHLDMAVWKTGTMQHSLSIPQSAFKQCFQLAKLQGSCNLSATRTGLLPTALDLWRIPVVAAQCQMPCVPHCDL